MERIRRGVVNRQITLSSLWSMGLVSVAEGTKVEWIVGNFHRFRDVATEFLIVVSLEGDQGAWPVLKGCVTWEIGKVLREGVTLEPLQRISSFKSAPLPKGYDVIDRDDFPEGTVSLWGYQDSPADDCPLFNLPLKGNPVGWRAPEPKKPEVEG